MQTAGDLHTGKLLSKLVLQLTFSTASFERNSLITCAHRILEYNSPLWSLTLKKDIISIESVQRKFTKRIPGMLGLSLRRKA